MLFLAVFCGFLAENQREHYVEHLREKQYMKSMVRDLATDTTTLNFIIKDFSEKIPAFDTVIENLPKLTHHFSAALIRGLSKIAGYEDLVLNDRTIQQLKNAGGMRLIRKANVSDSIMEYDRRGKDLLIEQEAISDFYYKQRSIGELIDVELWANLLKPGFAEKYEKENINILVTKDKSVLSKYLGYLYAYRGTSQLYIQVLKDVSSMATRLLILIKKEYNLK
jgi:hypothetical protein